MTTTDPCKKFACKLQQCLKDNIYQPSRCQSIIEEIRQCCIIHKQNSTVCDGIDTSKPYEHNTVDYVSTESFCIVHPYRGKHKSNGDGKG
ncbi:Mature T-cell proliferation 1 neighbor protein [Dufourea novaeangliae]|uniref:Mature T-cell proliferation 1 neighbor protein n=1 Tax=Dufourea novaeangliae TaxID=178035 RepID=A0A154P6L4_DUFNO|nr:Mature T-cell proliferation 1 neighbor protein [Dufourea novaeangliae]